MVRMRNVIAFGGAFAAFAMGSGFASGQEVLQFFSSFGLRGSLGAGAVALVIFVTAAGTVMADGRKRSSSNSSNSSSSNSNSSSIYRYYCGRRIGAVYEWMIPLLMYLFLTVMLSGAGAAFHEYYGISGQTGRILMAVLAVATMVLGLKRLIGVIGPMGLIILLFVLGISVASVLNNLEGLSAADRIMKEVTVPRASFAGSFWISGLLYGAFNLVTSLPFLAGMGRQAGSGREAFLAGAFGGASYAGGAILLNLALLANLPMIADKQIPFLWIARGVFPAIGSVYSVMLLAGIYTTAVPMLWSICDMFKEGQEEPDHWLLAVLIASLAVLTGHLPFSTLVGMLYPVIGFFGILLLGCMVYRKLVQSD